MAVYDGLADWYDRNVMSTERPLHAVASALLSELAGSGPGRCLDVGCGGGAFLPVLLDGGWQVTGIDVSQDQLRRARARVGARAELVEGDAAALPFEAGSFDLVVAT